MKSYCYMCRHYKKTKEKLIKVKYVTNTRVKYWYIERNDNVYNPDEYIKNYSNKVCMAKECFIFSKKDGLADKKYRKKAKMKRVISHIQLNDTNYCLYYSPMLFWWIVQKISHLLRIH